MLLQPYVKWNGKTVALSDGHGEETAGKRTPYMKSLKRSIRENEFNSAVVSFLAEKLRWLGFRVLLVAPNDYDTPLKLRVDRANSHNVDIYVSVHYNAIDGKFDGDSKDPSGHSVHIYPKSKESRKLAEKILKHLRGGTKQKNRGIVEQNLYETRETKMPSVLTENGFMDNEREANLMLNVSFQKEVATEHAKGICEYFGVQYSEPTPKASKPPKETKGKLFYRVVTGSFADRKNAEERMETLKKRGFDSFLEISSKSKKQYFRVVTGSFEDRENAEIQLEKLTKTGFESFLSVFHK